MQIKKQRMDLLHISEWTKFSGDKVDVFCSTYIEPILSLKIWNG